MDTDTALQPLGGASEAEIVEAIARRWFSRESFPPLSPDVWDRQPEEVKEAFREHARRFWARPGYAHAVLCDAKHRATSMVWELRQRLENSV